MCEATAGDQILPALTILLAAPRGFCARVDRAIQIVELALARYGAPVYVRHESWRKHAGLGETPPECKLEDPCTGRGAQKRTAGFWSVTEKKSGNRKAMRDDLITKVQCGEMDAGKGRI